MKVAAAVSILVALSFALIAGAQTTPQSPPPTAPSTRPTDQPAADVLNRMLKPNTNAPVPLQPIAPTTYPSKDAGPNAVAPAAPQMNLIREGSFIVDKTGRLTKSADGQQSQITFDSDGQSMQDPPMVIVPNLKLEQMEQAVANANRDLKFRVTGMVTEYHGQNHLLLEKVVVIPDIVQQF